MDKKTFNLWSFNIVLFYFAVFVICAICAVFSGCSTTRVSPVDNDVLSYQREIARLESTIERYNNEIGDCVEDLGRIRERAAGLEGTVDEVIYLFDEYQQGVERLLQRYRELQTYSRRENSGADIPSDTNGDKGAGSGSGLHTILQGD